MSTEIILHSIDDEEIIFNLEEYCRDNNLTLESEDIVIKNEGTGLVRFTISGNKLREQEVPGYGIYSPLVFEVEDSNIEQSALLAFLFMFYNTEVKFTIKDKEKENYLEEGSKEKFIFSEDEETKNNIANNL